MALKNIPDSGFSDDDGSADPRLAADEVLRGALVRGIELALLPADTRLPGEPLFTR